MRRDRLPELKLRPMGLLLACLALTLALGAYDLPNALGQNTAPVALELRGRPTAAERAKLHRMLRRHAEVLEAQAVVVKTVAKLVGPTVVHIEADVTPKTGRSRQRRRVEETGSGVIVRYAGKPYVLSNRHLVEGLPAEAVKIHLADGRLIHPTKIWNDPDTDIAVMRVEASDLLAAELGDSDKVETGDFVLAVGSPFGLSHSVTFGIISATGRRDLKLHDAVVRFQDFLQTDAAINPGNSGGPLVNLRGEVIGINTAIASNSGHNEGIGFAIPINMFMIISRQLIEHGKVARAFLGVDLDADFGPALAAELGLPYPVGTRITRLTKQSPAEAAGLMVGDVILEFNHVRVEDDAHLINLVSLTGVGKKVPVLVFRDRKTLTIEVEVGDRSKFTTK